MVKGIRAKTFRTLLHVESVVSDTYGETCSELGQSTAEDAAKNFAGVNMRPLLIMGALHHGVSRRKCLLTCDKLFETAGCFIGTRSSPRPANMRGGGCEARRG